MAGASDCPDTSWRPGVRDGGSEVERCDAECRAENRRRSDEGEAYALSHIPEPSELPRVDAVAEREKATVAATEKREKGEQRTLLAAAIVVGGMTRNPYAAGVLLIGGYFVVTRPSLDFGRLPSGWLTLPQLSFHKPPRDAWDKNGAKAPGRPGAETGFQDPKGGPRWGRTDGGDWGWEDADGKIWVPSGSGSDAHGGPHWDVQNKDGTGHRNVYPGGHER